MGDWDLEKVGDELAREFSLRSTAVTRRSDWGVLNVEGLRGEVVANECDGFSSAVC